MIGGAGGVGSILIQLARQLTGLTVIATASRPETQAWCIELGAHHVIDHTKPFPEQLSSIGFSRVNLIAGLTATDQHYPAVVDVLAPQGKFGLIDDPNSLDARPLKQKAASLHWEFMFRHALYSTRPTFSSSTICQPGRRTRRNGSHSNDRRQRIRENQCDQSQKGSRIDRKRPFSRQNRACRFLTNIFDNGAATARRAFNSQSFHRETVEAKADISPINVLWENAGASK